MCQWSWVLVKNKSVLPFWLLASEICIFGPGKSSTTLLLTDFFSPPLRRVNDSSGSTKNEMKSAV